MIQSGEHGHRTLDIPQSCQELLRDVLPFFPDSQDQGIWLVGGTVRDLLTGPSQVLDLDLAVPFNPVPFAKKYARSRQIGFVVLDEERGIARIVRNHPQGQLTLDLAQFRAETIEKDLRKRDFTMNAIAVRVDRPPGTPSFPLFDPLHGEQHLRSGVLQACSDESFRDDPLRLLRAVRFAARFSLAIPGELRGMIERDAGLIPSVSMERVRDEVFKTLSYARSAFWFRFLSETGLLRNLLPELEETKGFEQNQWHHLDLFDHTLLTLETFETLLADSLEFEGKERFHAFLAEPISGGRTYGELFKFACLLHDLGKVNCRKIEESGRVVFHGHEMTGVYKARDIAQRFRLSSAELHFLGGIIKNHMRPGVLVQEGISDRRLFRYFSENGRNGVGIALLSLADRLSALGPDMQEDLEAFRAGILQIMGDFYRQLEYRKTAPLLTGDDLKTEFDLPAGPLFRELLVEVREQHHLGKIKSRDEAVVFVRKLLAAK